MTELSLTFLDTNVLLYSVDDRVPAKRDRAQQWVTACWTRRCGRTSAQVLEEFLVRRRGEEFDRHPGQPAVNADGIRLLRLSVQVGRILLAAPLQNAAQRGPLANVFHDRGAPV